MLMNLFCIETINIFKIFSIDTLWFRIQIHDFSSLVSSNFSKLLKTNLALEEQKINYEVLD
jgi:hypothetical protein